MESIERIRLLKKSNLSEEFYFSSLSEAEITFRLSLNKYINSLSQEKQILIERVIKLIHCDKE